MKVPIGDEVSPKGVVVGVVGLALRGVGVGWSLEGLFGQIALWLEVPVVFRLMHGLLGYGDAGKNLALLERPLPGCSYILLFATLQHWFWPGPVLKALF